MRGQRIDGRPPARVGQLPFRDYLAERARERVLEATRHLSFRELLALTPDEVVAKLASPPK